MAANSAFNAFRKAREKALRNGDPSFVFNGKTYVRKHSTVGGKIIIYKRRSSGAAKKKKKKSRGSR